MFNNHLYEEVILTMRMKKSGVMKENTILYLLTFNWDFMYNYFEFVRDETVREIIYTVLLHLLITIH